MGDDFVGPVKILRSFPFPVNHLDDTTLTVVNQDCNEAVGLQGRGEPLGNPTMLVKSLACAIIFAKSGHSQQGEVA